MLYLVGDELGDDSSTSIAGTVVRSKVCQTLPEEVVEAVLLRLPAAAQARCRAVCKAWLALLTNPEFSRRSFFQSLSRTTPPLCAVRFFPQENYTPFQEDLGEIVMPRYKALKVDMSFLPEVFLSGCLQPHSCSPCGLMCISRVVVEGTLVCVFNPLNQSFKVLPLLQKRWSYEVALLMGAVTATESTPSFKVYVYDAGPPGPNYSRRLHEDVAIYSSISGEWKGFLGPKCGEVSRRGLWPAMETCTQRWIALPRGWCGLARRRVHATCGIWHCPASRSVWHCPAV